jgi:hypothetical protein
MSRARDYACGPGMMDRKLSTATYTCRYCSSIILWSCTGRVQLMPCLDCCVSFPGSLHCSSLRLNIWACRSLRSVRLCLLGCLLPVATDCPESFSSAVLASKRPKQPQAFPIQPCLLLDTRPQPPQVQLAVPYLCSDASICHRLR